MTASPRRRDIYVVRDFWDAATCAGIRAAIGAGHHEPAQILAGDYVVDVSTRHAMDVDVDEATCDRVTASILSERDAISVFFGVSLADWQGPGFLRYPTGGLYRPHRDRAAAAAADGLGERLVSLVVFLNDAGDGVQDCEGGALRISGTDSDDDSHFPPERGTLIAFDAGLVHEVLPVRRGPRDAVVGWFCDYCGPDA